MNAKKTATKRKSEPPENAARALVDKNRLAAMARYIEEIDRFAVLLRESQAEITARADAMAIAKNHYELSKDAVREAKEIEHNTVALLLKLIVPGSCEILPLFDQMEETDEDKHGEGSTEWRKEPIAALKLSAAALRALIDADVVLVGQLQDRMLAKPEDWFDSLGLSNGMAEAIAEKLHDFMAERAK